MNAHYEVVIVGGGIHGAGVAQAAAVRGYRTLLLEQHTLAAGTSSRSSKLIHGGLRYLESGAIRLVRESLREREILLGIAPGLVERKAFHIPVYGSSRRSARHIHMGLLLYRLLAHGAAGGFTRVAPSEWDGLDGLKTAGLKAVFRYMDAQTDDVALTHAVARSAEAFGAEIRTGARFIGAERAGAGYEVRSVHDGVVSSCRTDVLVNAAGPWAAQTLSGILPGPPRLPHDLVAGTHIITDGSLTQGCYYIEAPADHRAVFVLPWRGRILTGTTERLYVGDPALVAPTPTEIAYLQEALAAHFPGLSTSVADSFAGLRVLPKTGSGLSARSRETVLLADAPMPHLISIFGGKLTGYRHTAERVMDRFQPVLPRRVAQADTRRLVLPVD
ncbi:glycerol-3-phosphate dehydrogenase/oxidase [Acidiferrobacter thiooxydans]|uniref:FAD-dependent oxidoreductase n=1 Tax=Acidiferrobacter thiooxydans TaxID=163359 RepID=A0A1C2G2C7_9GAMM|nr:FAD-dependent oxidoreductase [Acidiferrobacter thiooxydans]RCN58253.1 FAD-dependent oxidoreductase [Acidiferrobacter thiooxydans]UEN99849.1 FAD-dependent oxidoreductase [Acidiferrobacter thiooxydans]